MHVPTGHRFPDATGVAFALGLGPPSLLAAIFAFCYCWFFDIFCVSVVNKRLVCSAFIPSKCTHTHSSE